MIITALANLIHALLNVLLVFNLPQLPTSVVSVANQAVEYMNTGIQIIGAFTGSTTLGVLAVLVNLFLLAHTAYMLYSFVRFILRKIPMLGIDM